MAYRKKKFVTKNEVVNLESCNSLIIQNQGNTVAYFDDIMLSAKGGSITLAEILALKGMTTLEEYNWDCSISFDETGVSEVDNKLLVYKIFYDTAQSNRCR